MRMNAEDNKTVQPQRCWCQLCAPTMPEPEPEPQVLVLVPPFDGPHREIVAPDHANN
jgi:hypothetical protein